MLQSPSPETVLTTTFAIVLTALTNLVFLSNFLLPPVSSFFVAVGLLCANNIYFFLKSKDYLKANRVHGMVYTCVGECGYCLSDAGSRKPPINGREKGFR